MKRLFFFLLSSPLFVSANPDCTAFRPNRTIAGFVMGNEVRRGDDTLVGFIAGDEILPRNGIAVGYVRDGVIWSRGAVQMGSVVGDEIRRWNGSGAGTVEGACSTEAKGAAGLLLLIAPSLL